MLSLHKLEIFAGVVQHGSFTEAARHFYMTQSAVSQHIGDLESALGTRLFKRGRRGVTLTSSGEILHNYTVEILRLLGEAESAVTDVTQLVEGQTTIGATPTISVYLLPTWIRDFREHHPNLTVSLKTDITSNIIERVMNHQLDLGFIEGELEQPTPASLGVRVLDEIDLYVITNKQNPLTQVSKVQPHMLNDYPFVMRPPDSHTRRWMDGILSANGVVPRISAEFDNPESIKQAVAMGNCISILPDYAIRSEEASERFALLHVEGLPLKRELKLVWDQQVAISPIARALLQHLRPSYPMLDALFSNQLRVPIT